MQDAVGSVRRHPEYSRFQKRIFKKAKTEVSRWYPSFSPRLRRGFPAKTNVLFYEFSRAAEFIDPDAASRVNNKLITEQHLCSADVPTTQTRLFWDGAQMNVLGRAPAAGTALFAKPVDGAGGNGAHIYRGGSLPDGQQYLLQDVIIQSADTAKFNPASLNTLRVLTYRKIDGEFSVIAITFRMGVGDGVVDNASAGGIFCTIDPVTGTFEDYARGNMTDIHYQHPTTGLAFRDQKIDQCADIAAICKKAHDAYPSRYCLAFDVALTDDGPRVIEVNAFFGLRTLAGYPSWRSKVLRRFIEDHDGCTGGFVNLTDVVQLQREMLVNVNISVSGSVQGVGFRRAVQKLAERLCLNGVAKNLDDGTVAIDVSGPLGAVEVLVQRLRRATPRTNVTAIDAKIIDVMQVRRFAFG